MRLVFRSFINFFAADVRSSLKFLIKQSIFGFLMFMSTFFQH